MLRPFPGKNLPSQKAIFNYRLSRARRIIENSFGILAARYVFMVVICKLCKYNYCNNYCLFRWRLFRRPIIADPGNVVIFAKAAIALHNYLRTEDSVVYCPTGYIDGEDGSGNLIPGLWRNEELATGLLPIGTISSNRYTSIHAIYSKIILISTLTLISTVRLDLYFNLDSHFNFQIIMQIHQNSCRHQTSDISLCIISVVQLAK